MANKKKNDVEIMPKATVKEWLGLSVLLLGAFLYVMDLTVLHLAVPTLSEELKPSSAQLLWIIDIYGFMVAGFLVTMGSLGDRIGRRKLLMLGAAVFGAFSIMAAFSKSSEMLILSRALLGIAGATLGPSTLSLIFSMFKDPYERSKAIGLWISSFSAGSAVGPILGGVLLEHFWWGSVFLLAVPVMALILILGPKVLPEYKDPKAGKIDLISVAFSLIAILSIIFGLKQIAQDGISTLPTVSILFGMVMGFVFARRQFNLRDPMIDLTLFKVPAFSAALVVNILAVFVAFGYFLFVAQYLQLVLGLSPLHAGLWSVPSAIGFIIGSNVAPRIAHLVKPVYVITAGLLFAALGLGVLTQIAGGNGLFITVLASVIISLGMGPVFGLTTEMVVGSAPPERAGAASGISETAAELGGAVGISVLGSIGVAIYRSKIVEGLPQGIPAEAIDVAKDTLGAAAGAAAKLPPDLGTALMQAASNAFVAGMQTVAWISFTVAIIAAFITYFMLRKIKASSH